MFFVKCVMIYKIFLVEYMKPTHVWLFHDFDTACRHFQALCDVYSEVNEVQPFMFKLGHEHVNDSLSKVLNSYCVNLRV